MKTFKPGIKSFMMWIGAPLIFGVLIASVLWQSGQAATSGTDMPDPKANSLWEYITTMDNYENWQSWPGKAGMYEGQSPHGDYLKLYVNPEAFQALERQHVTMPYRAIIVKENYNEKKRLIAITPMYKVEGYDARAGDWFWAKYGTDGSVMASGKTSGCIDCHSKVKDNDFLFSVAD
ncbi:MAG: cytochrome P460 family protein [Bacteroidales bacterium]